MKIRPVRDEWFHGEDGSTDRQTDMTKLTVAFRKFAKTCKKFNSGCDYIRGICHREISVCSPEAGPGRTKKITDYDDVEKVLTLASNRRQELISTGNRKICPVL